MLLRSSAARASLGIAGLVVVGCSAPVVDDVADARDEMTQGVVLIERTEPADGATQTNVSAKFMRMSAMSDPETAERVVGTRLDLPPRDECLVMAPFEPSEEATTSLAALGPIELLDVGDVTLRTGEAVMALAPRAFPDLGDLVSGVFYTSRDAASELPSPASYLLESTGSASIDRFLIEADAPASPAEVLLGERELAEGVALEEGAPAAFRWAPSVPSVAGDVVYVDVSAASTGITIRCSFGDTGEGAIPGSLLRGETLGALPATVTIGLHRVRRGTFGSASPAGAPAGIDLGEVRFDLGVIGRAVVEPSATH